MTVSLPWKASLCALAVTAFAWNALAQQPQGPPAPVHRVQGLIPAFLPCVPQGSETPLVADERPESTARTAPSVLFPMYDWQGDSPPSRGLYILGQYIDDNPAPGVITDFMGRDHAYDGHRGFDLGYTFFRKMDEGLRILPTRMYRKYMEKMHPFKVNAEAFANQFCEEYKQCIEDAKKHLVEVPLVGSTIPHVVQAKFGAAEVFLKPAAPGTGIIAGGGVRNGTGRGFCGCVARISRTA